MKRKRSKSHKHHKKAKRAKKETKMRYSTEDLPPANLQRTTKKDDGIDSPSTRRRKKNRRSTSSSSSSSSSSNYDSEDRRKPERSLSRSTTGSETNVSRRKWKGSKSHSESNRSSVCDADYGSSEIINHAAVSQEDFPSEYLTANLDKAKTKAEAKEAAAKSAHEEATDSDDGSRVNVSNTQPPTPDMERLKRQLEMTSESDLNEMPQRKSEPLERTFLLDIESGGSRRSYDRGCDASRNIPRTDKNDARDSPSNRMIQSSVIKAVADRDRPSRSKILEIPDSLQSSSFEVPSDRRFSSSPQVKCCWTPTQFTGTRRHRFDTSPQNIVTNRIPELSNRKPEAIATSATNVQCQIRRKTYGLIDYDFEDVGVADDLRFIDTHCHLDFLFKRLDMKLDSYRSYRKLFASFYPKSYEGCVAIFCDPKTFGNHELWSSVLNEPDVWATFGCHPHMAREYNDKVEGHLLEALEHKKVVALGEIGLDYSHKNNCDKDVQKRVFRRQLSIALRKKLPLVIHSRESTEDTLDILKEVLPRDYKIHRHCFTGDLTEANLWLETFPNLFIGLTSLVTYPSATPVHEVAREIPLSRLLLETDAPYFLPRMTNKNARWSHPGMAIHVAAQIAALRSKDVIEDVLKQTRLNTTKMYNI